VDEKPAFGRWMPIQNPPDEGRWVLVFDAQYRRERIAKLESDWLGGSWTTDEGSWMSTDQVSHWMPLPEPPAGGSSDA
jgi:hypothetical protein